MYANDLPLLILNILSALQMLQVQRKRPFLDQH